MDVTDRYFNDTTFIFKLLRFLNLMEPGRAVISLTKLFLLTTVIALMIVMVNHPDNIAAVIGATGTAMAGLGAYVVRRQQNLNRNIGIDSIMPVDEPGEIDWLAGDPNPEAEENL